MAKENQRTNFEEYHSKGSGSDSDSDSDSRVRVFSSLRLAWKPEPESEVQVHVSGPEKLGSSWSNHIRSKIVQQLWGL